MVDDMITAGPWPAKSNDTYSLALVSMLDQSSRDFPMGLVAEVVDWVSGLRPNSGSMYMNY